MNSRPASRNARKATTTTVASARPGPKRHQNNDDFAAARQIVDILETFDADAQLRILRWASERMGSLDQLEQAISVPAGSSTEYVRVLTINAPDNDRIFAAAVAYAQQFHAPAGFAKRSISTEDLRRAASMVQRNGPKHPAQTLINAEGDGLLKKVGHGRYTLSAKGRKLVEQRAQGGPPA